MNEDTMDELRRTVLLVAHGSREEAANREVRETAQRISQILDSETVIPCFLEILSPSLEEAFREAVEQGARLITVVPYFLTSGAHVTQDIPAILRRAEERYGGRSVSVTITQALGPDPDLDAIVLKRIRRTP